MRENKAATKFILGLITMTSGVAIMTATYLDPSLPDLIWYVRDQVSSSAELIPPGVPIEAVDAMMIFAITAILLCPAIVSLVGALLAFLGAAEMARGQK